MLSRRRSQVFSRKGSMLRSRESRFGASGGRGVAFEGSEREARVGGNVRASFGGALGRLWRKDVRRCELWIVTGSSWRMSWYRRPLFWRLGFDVRH